MIQHNEKIIQTLNQKGFQAEWQTITKNGVLFNAILIKMTEDYSPIIYTDNLLNDNDTIESAIEKIISKFNEIKSIPFEAVDILNRDYILNHITIALQKDGNEPILKRESGFDGIEAYLLILDQFTPSNEYFSMKVSIDLLAYCHVTEHEAWECAEKNLKESVVIESLQELIGLPIGMDDLFVVTNKCSIKGASGVLVTELMKEFAEKHHTHKIALLPSSIHEMLLLPNFNLADEAELSAMVRDANQVAVLPEEQLSDRVYYMEL